MSFGKRCYPRTRDGIRQRFSTMSCEMKSLCTRGENFNFQRARLIKAVQTVEKRVLQEESGRLRIIKHWITQGSFPPQEIKTIGISED